MHGYDAKEWNLLPSERKQELREAYAAQFGRSWVATCLTVRRRKGQARVFIRLRPNSGRKGKPLIDILD